ncbi:MAG: hypothetical protein IJ463_02450 [Bacilli bacterium]|nr:hypothetical protein [Bacilli bacterium]
MKRIFNYIVLIVICLLPVMVSAQSKLELVWSKDDEMFLYEEDDYYSFITYQTYNSEYGNMLFYDDKGKFVYQNVFFDPANDSLDEFYNSNKYDALLPYLNYKEYGWELTYSKELESLIYIEYNDEEFTYYDVNNNDITVSFYDDIEFTKKALGKKFEVYDALKDKLYFFYRIDIFDNVSVVYYQADDYYCHAYIVDNDSYELIMDYNSELYEYFSVYEKNGLIFLCTADYNLRIYNLDGELVDSFAIESEWFNKDEFGYCGSFVVNKYAVHKDKLFLTYRYLSCPKRYGVKDASELEVVQKDDPYPRVFTHVYDINFDVIKVESNNGDFTYETVEDDGESYVELKITPKDGYSVEEIIVTDVNGNRIEVTNNKFIMPMSDVKVEVKYVKGEYLPIPDTFLSRSVSLILIGLILVSLGFYTINYVRQE